MTAITWILLSVAELGNHYSSRWAINAFFPRQNQTDAFKGLFWCCSLVVTFIMVSGFALLVVTVVVHKDLNQTVNFYPSRDKSFAFGFKLNIVRQSLTSRFVGFSVDLFSLVTKENVVVVCQKLKFPYFFGLCLTTLIVCFCWYLWLDSNPRLLDSKSNEDTSASNGSLTEKNTFGTTLFVLVLITLIFSQIIPALCHCVPSLLGQGLFQKVYRLELPPPPWSLSPLGDRKPKHRKPLPR